MIPDLPDLAADSAAAIPAPDTTFKASIAQACYEESGIGPEDLSLAEVYDLSTAMELDWYEDIGLCGAGEAEKLLRDGATEIGGRIPVNASGGLASFGEAVPAQALAQVCEVTWQLRGQAGHRQVEGSPHRDHRQPGPLRPRLLGAAGPVVRARSCAGIAHDTAPGRGHARRTGADEGAHMGTVRRLPGRDGVGSTATW